MNKYKALALDIDGTLLNSEKEVTPEVFKAVRRLQEAGVPVMIAQEDRNRVFLMWHGRLAWIPLADIFFPLMAGK